MEASFLPLVARGLQVSDCYNVLAVAGLLNGPLDRHVERCSMALYDSFKLSIRSRGEVLIPILRALG
jgi:hypothetical protein